ncbi:MAG: LLM class flavin-dependent oxidoreductase [Pseudomonadota bacterium]
MAEAYVQLGLHPATAAAAEAARLEAAGWDGVMVFDSQNLLVDPYVALTLAATSTNRLGLGIGVTNTVTRHPAVSAAAIWSLHEASGGRAVIGMGRGNSALFNLGAGPVRLAAFETHVRQLMAYVDGDVAEWDTAGAEADTLALDAVAKGAAPRASRLKWLPPNAPPPVVEIAATGPKVMAIGARHAPRVSVSVGANLDRLGWAARQIRAATPADREVPKLTAYVSVVADDDAAWARQQAAPEVAMHTHILAMQKNADYPASVDERDIINRVANVYDMNRHGNFGPQTDALPEWFIAGNAVAGTPAECVDKLRAIAALGFDRIVYMVPIQAGLRPLQAIEQGVLPKLA